MTSDPTVIDGFLEAIHPNKVFFLPRFWLSHFFSRSLSFFFLFLCGLCLLGIHIRGSAPCPWSAVLRQSSLTMEEGPFFLHHSYFFFLVISQIVLMTQNTLDLWRFTRPDDRDTPLEYIDFQPLLRALSVKSILRIYLSLLLERFLFFINHYFLARPFLSFWTFLLIFRLSEFNASIGESYLYRRVCRRWRRVCRRVWRCCTHSSGNTSTSPSSQSLWWRLCAHPCRSLWVYSNPS